MSPRPYSERVGEPPDFKSVSEELPSAQGQPGGGDATPSSPTTSGSLSPQVFLEAPTHIVPILSEDGIPYDHTLPHYLRQVSGESSLEEVHNITLRVLTATASLQQMTIYTPNLRELNLEGSALSSLRDLGSELRGLQVLSVNRCRLRCLDGTLGLTGLRELYAASNFLASAAPCAHLSRLRVLDLSRNWLQDKRTLSFLASCKHLQSLRVEDNEAARDPEIQNYLQSILPALLCLDDTPLTPRESTEGDTEILNGPQEVTGSPRTFERQESFNTDNSSGSTNTSVTLIETNDTGTGSYSVDCQPCSSGTTSVSKLTSGEILCGNMATHRPRRTIGISVEKDDDEPNKDELDASRRWRVAYYKFRQINADRWQNENNQRQEETKDHSQDTETGEESSSNDGCD